MGMQAYSTQVPPREGWLSEQSATRLNNDHQHVLSQGQFASSPTKMGTPIRLHPLLNSDRTVPFHDGKGGSFGYDNLHILHGYICHGLLIPTQYKGAGFSLALSFGVGTVGG